jgi:diaminopimelate epimerase
VRIAVYNLTMRFTKMHGIGNDYVYVNGFVEKVGDPVKTAQFVSDRHFGIGSDGLILILPSDRADVRMRMFNADGSESEMCGNGVRCVAKYAYDHGLSKNNPMNVETGRGVLSIALDLHEGKVRAATVNMGEPILEAGRIPVVIPGVEADERVVNVPFAEAGRTSGFQPQRSTERQRISQLLLQNAVRVARTASKPAVRDMDCDVTLPLDVPVDEWAGWVQHSGLELKLTCVSMGNPHLVLNCARINAIPLAGIGPSLERHSIFPNRINVHFVEVRDRAEVTMRTWERGSGITLACGTGACAVCVAGVLTGRTDRKILAHLPGGDLSLEWRESDNNVYLTGPATEVFSGEWPSL